MNLTPILITAYVILSFSLWAWAITDILKNEFKKSSLKFRWILIVMVFPVFGAILYFQLKRKVNRKESNPQFNK